MARKTYKIRKGAMVASKDAQKVGERLSKLTLQSGGELTPDRVIEDAKGPRSIFHKYFDWDDTSAAIKYRKVQARHIMGAVVEVVVVKGTKRHERSFFNVKNQEGESIYVTLETVTETPDYLCQLIDEAQEGMARLNRTLDMLSVQLRKKGK